MTIIGIGIIIVIIIIINNNNNVLNVELCTECEIGRIVALVGRLVGLLVAAQQIIQANL